MMIVQYTVHLNAFKNLYHLICRNNPEEKGPKIKTPNNRLKLSEIAKAAGGGGSPPAIKMLENPVNWTIDEQKATNI